jgi:thiol-disulfide isomerase/thioredoxin
MGSMQQRTRVLVLSWIVAIAAAVLVTSLAAAGHGPPAPAPHSTGAVDFALEDINPKSATHGKSVTLSELYREQGVVLKFVASWCAVCRDELPAIESFARSGRVPLVYVAADEWGHRESMIILAERHELTRPLLFVPEAAAEAFARDWRYEILPATYVIDRAGRVREAFEGVVPVERLAEAVERSLSAPSP